MQLSTIALLISAAAAAVFAGPVEKRGGYKTTTSCPKDGKIFGDPADCTVFYICDHGEPVKFHCGPGTVFDDALMVCVHPPAHGCPGYTPPPVAYTPPVYTPPAYTPPAYTPPAYTPPAYNYTPPASNYTTPVANYTPPAETYTPPAASGH